MTTTLRYTVTTVQRVSVGESVEAGFDRRAADVLPGVAIRGALASRWLGGSTAKASSPEFLGLFESGAMSFGPAASVGSTLRPQSQAKCKYPTPNCQGLIDAARIGAEIDATICPTCKGAVRESHGWHSKTMTNPQSRTQLENGVAKTGNLFIRRSLPAGTTLVGYAYLNDDAAVAFLRPDEAEHTVWVGGQRSTHGKCSISFTRQLGVGDIHRRTAGGTLVVAVAPVVSTDAAGLPAAQFPATLGGGVLKQWLRFERVSGFHPASGLPKPADWALSPASAALTRDPIVVDQIGERNGEGYGLVIGLHPGEELRVTADGWTSDPLAAGPAEVANAPTWSVETILSGVVEQERLSTARWLARVLDEWLSAQRDRPEFDRGTAADVLLSDRIGRNLPADVGNTIRRVLITSALPVVLRLVVEARTYARQAAR